MSTRSLLRRRSAVALVATGTLLLIPSAALADPPALNRDPCAVLLAQAAHWPGSIDTATGTVRLVSDAYVTYLSRQPECRATGD
jgi:hypothetical protein